MVIMAGAPTLFSQYRMGNLTLPNRIVMAPMTRNRAGDAAIPVLIINACKRRFNFFIFRNHFIYTDFFYLGSVGKVHDYPNFDSFFHRNKFNNST
jgi:hypothetical protein